MSLAIPFVGRGKEAAQLQRLHGQGRHALVLGAAGVGKTSLIRHVACSLDLLVCAQSVRLSEICSALEPQLGLVAGDLHMIPRKNLLMRRLAEEGKTVVFDGAGWTTPKLNAFLDQTCERVPVWLCSRSELACDVGHFWQHLWKFERVELHPLHPAETHAIIKAGVEMCLVPAAALDAADRLHKLSAGNPRVLVYLLEGLASGRYDPHRKFDLELLEVDRRIHEIFPETGKPPI